MNSWSTQIKLYGQKRGVREDTLPSDTYNLSFMLTVLAIGLQRHAYILCIVCRST